MPLQLLIGPVNARKAGRVLDAHQEAAGAGHPAWLIVPTERARLDAIAELSGFAPHGASPRQPTPYGEVLSARAAERRLAELLLPDVALLSDDARAQLAEAAVGRALAGGRLDELEAAARAGWLAGEIVRLSDELHATADAGAAAESGLRDWARTPGGGARASELAALLADDRRVLDALASDGVPDRARAAVAASARLRQDGAPAGLHVALAGFDDLDPIQRLLVTALHQAGAGVVLSLPYAEGREALSAAAGLVGTLRAAGAQTEPVEAGSHGVVAPEVAAVQTQLYEQRVEGEVSRGASAPGGPGHEGAADAPLGLPPLLELAGEDPDAEMRLLVEELRARLERGIAAEDVAVVVPAAATQGPAVVAALTRAGLPAHLAGRARVASGETAGALLALLRAAGPQGTAHDLVRWLQACEPDRALRLDVAVRRTPLRTTAEALAAWRRLGGGRVDALDRIREARRAEPGALEDAAADLLAERIRARLRPSGAMPSGAEAMEVRGAAELAAALRDRGSLSRQLAAMQDVPPPAPGPAELADRLAELRLPAAGEPGASIAVLGPLDVRSRRVRVLAIARAQRGSFPASASMRRALVPVDRAQLMAHGWPPPAEPSHDAVERALAYETIGTATDALIVSWHRGDGDGGAAEPSPLVLELRRVAGSGLPRRERPAGADLPGSGSPVADPRIAEALAGPRHRERVHERAAALTRPEGGSHAVRALQQASRCPAQWFAEQHLRPQPLEPDPAPLASGLLRHDLLARLLRGAMERGVELGPEALPGLRADLTRLGRDLAAAAGDDEPLADRLRRERVVAEVEATLPALCGTELLAHQPSELELSFGTVDDDAPDDEEGGRPPVKIERGGAALSLRGRIDRLDLDRAGREALVIDYKGANVDAYAGARWVDRRELQAALYALVAEELTGADAVGSLYQAVPGPVDRRPRGLVVGGLDGRKTTWTDEVDETTWSETLDALVLLAAEAAARIDAGVVSPSPSTCSEQGCRYPWLCRPGGGA